MSFNKKQKKLWVYVMLIIMVLGAHTTYGYNIFPETVGMEGTVKGKQVNLRSYPDLQSQVVDRVGQTTLRVVGKHEDWYKVATFKNQGWVYKDYIQVSRPELIPYAKVQGEEIIEYGMQFLGTPYVWGGSNLKTGVDCSGFTQEVFDYFDIQISRVSYMQANDGQTIPKSELRCGDLVFFDTSGVNQGNISHVGIYMGDNQFIHSDSTRGVAISNLSSPYYTRNYVKGVRLLQG
ncbi:MAG: NlpC/P60 family protein [Cellulosilyticaceae bacterium]